MTRQDHWEDVYRVKGDTELSWFQVQPAMSLSLIDGLKPAPSRIIDVGGGQSALAGELIGRGVAEVTVLDVSRAAIERGRARLGAIADRVRWVVGDVLDDLNLGEFDLWHDRAVFHFLTEPEERGRYLAAVSRSVAIGGHVLVATFALSGPERCSGLPVCRYDARRLADEFGPAFRLIRSAEESHATPWGKAQNFVYVLLSRERA